MDAPRLPDSALADLALLSRVVLLVFQPTVKDVRFVRAAISFLADVGVPQRRIVPVANRVKKRGPLVRMEDSKKVVGLDSFACIRSDWCKAMRSVNLAQPLAQAAKRSSLRKDFQKLAAKIHSNGTNGKNTERG